MLCLVADPASLLANVAHLAPFCLFGHESDSFGLIWPYFGSLAVNPVHLAYSVANTAHLAANRGKPARRFPNLPVL